MPSVIDSVVVACVPRWLRCLLGDHDYLTHRASGRVWLQCLHCQHETPGFRVAIR